MAPSQLLNEKQDYLGQYPTYGALEFCDASAFIGALVMPRSELCQEKTWLAQARAAALMRQNMELQQRQSSLERRAAFQKGLMAANRDHMQVSCIESDTKPLY